MEKGTRKLRRKRFWKKEMDGGHGFQMTPQKCKLLWEWGNVNGWQKKKKNVCAVRSERFAHLQEYSIPVCSADLLTVHSSVPMW